MASMAPILIDGSVLEGGGQLLRNAISLSALLSKPVSISKIRAGRSTPGLKAQHIAGINLVGEICEADVSPNPLTKSSTQSLDFTPKRRRLGRSYRADPQTAGSTTLLLQIALPPLLFSHRSSCQEGHSLLETSLKLRGGTNAIQAPQIDYTSHVLLPFLKKHWDIDINLEIRKRGYWPKGGGEVLLTIPALTNSLSPINITERGKVTTIRGYSYAAGLPGHIAKATADAASLYLTEHAPRLGYQPSSIVIESKREPPAVAVASGSGIVLWAETESGCIIGGSAVGSKTKIPEEVGREAAKELERNLEHGGCVDEYLQDQIIIFMAIASGKSTIATGPITLHTRTAIWVAELLTPAKFTITESEGIDLVTIDCEGMGFTPGSCFPNTNKKEAED